MSFDAIDPDAPFPRQKVQYNQKVQECQSLRTELSRFVSTPTTPAVSTASSAASAHAGLSSASRSPPSSRVASPTSSPSYIPNIAAPLSRMALSRSASVAPSAHTRSASVAPASPTRAASTAPTRVATPGYPSTTHRSATPALSSFRSTTPASPSPMRKSRTMSMSQQPPLPPSDRWPAALTAAVMNPSAPSAASRPLGPRIRA
ncbi:hypothetical protein BJV78DRAFT_924484 [Lactifluus subvellereus]|nr:hypothetical protein BJV78DRAFT_924484 [Lactifluus subvellereus]